MTSVTSKLVSSMLMEAIKAKVQLPGSSIGYYSGIVWAFSVDVAFEMVRAAGCRRTGFCSSKRRLDGKTVLITGGNCGLGITTAEDMWRRGADVVITARNPTKGEAAMEEMRTRSRGEERRGTLRMAILDLSSLDSVRRSAEQLLATTDKIDILINNAGVMNTPFTLTEDGFELQFATNHLGHFLLTLLLLPRLLEAAPSRIVVVSSIAHRFYNELDIDGMNDSKRYYPFHAYSRSKSANIMFVRELAKHLEGTGVTVYSVHPGYVTTKLQRHGSEMVFNGFTWFTDHILAAIAFKSPWQGAQTIIHCAVCESTENDTGLYYEECRVKKPSDSCLDDKACKDLWQKSLVWVGLNPDYDIFGIRQEIITSHLDLEQD